MKRNKRERLIVAGVGAAFVVGLLTLSNIYNPSPKITTPEQDALMLELKMHTVHSEIDLRNLEKLAYEYEIAYRHSYGGAKAMYFKSLAEPIIVAAGDRREAIRAEEDILAEAQNKFNSTLNDIDEAWRMKLGTVEESLAIIAENDAKIAEIEAEIEALVLRKQQLGEEAWSGPGGKLDEKCLEEIGNVEKSIVKCQQDIAVYAHKTHVIELAYRLQNGTTLERQEPVVFDECCDCCCEDVEVVE